jgi:Family of unknown function (DUF6283)
MVKTAILSPVIPCGSCPYRKDVPSGIWAKEEYEKLPGYDNMTALQPTTMFLCHQQDGRVCAGWAGTHDMAESLGLRIAEALGYITTETARLICDYRTDIPLFASGSEAAKHGMRKISRPSKRACSMATNILRKRNLPAFPLRYTWKLVSLWGAARSPLYNKRCRIVARGAMNSRLIELEDGTRHVVSGNALRRLQ